MECRIILVFLCVVFTTLTTLPTFAVNTDQLKAKEYVIAELLTHTERKHLTIAGKLLSQSPHYQRDLFDMAAYQAWQHHNEHLDASAWLIKAIGNSSDPRYKPILNKIKQSAKNKKIHKYNNAALKNITGSVEDDIFTLENYDFVSVRENILNSRSKGLFKKDHIANIKIDDSLDDVFNKLGKPSRVSVFRKIKKTKYRPILGTYSQELHDFQLTYELSGIIRFHLVDKKYIVSDIIKDPFYEYPYENVLPVDNVDAKYQRLLSIKDPKETRKLVKEILRDKTYEKNNLDIAAYKIWLEKDNDDKSMLDAMALLITHIGKSKNGRYRVFLTHLMEESSEAEITSHARVALKYSYKNIDNIKQFVPYSI